jgi:hypothetical protein
MLASGTIGPPIVRGLIRDHRAGSSRLAAARPGLPVTPHFGVAAAE